MHLVRDSERILHLLRSGDGCFVEFAVLLRGGHHQAGFPESVKPPNAAGVPTDILR